MKKVIEVKNLYKLYRVGDEIVRALDGVNFEIYEGEFCAIVGTSGSGKSTLLNIIGGIDEADSGSIVIEGEKIEDMNEKTLTRYRRKHLGYVFQMYNLIPNLTVKENMEVGAYLSDHPLDINDLLKTLGLYDHRDKLPNQLSGGQQQRVSIARALALNPELLFFDEPTSALDPELTGEILKVIKSLAEEKMTMVIVTHEMQFASEISDRIIFMDGGYVIENGTPDEVFNNSQNERTRQFLERYHS